jgi:hypothetical protein
MSFYDNVAPARKWRGAAAEDEGLPDYAREAVGYSDYGQEAGYPQYGKEVTVPEVGNGAGAVQEWKGIKERVKEIEFEDRRERKLQRRLAALESKLDEMLRRLDGKTGKSEEGEEVGKNDDRPIFRSTKQDVDWRAIQEIEPTIPREMIWAMPREIGDMREWTLDRALEQTMDQKMDRVRARISGLEADQRVNRTRDLASEWAQEIERRREEFEGVGISNRQLRRQKALEARRQNEEEAALVLERGKTRAEERRQKKDEMRRQKKEEAALALEKRRQARELRGQKIEDISVSSGRQQRAEDVFSVSSQRAKDRSPSSEIGQEVEDVFSPSSGRRQRAEDVFSASPGRKERKERKDYTPAKEDAQKGDNSSPWEDLVKVRPRFSRRVQ